MQAVGSGPHHQSGLIILGLILQHLRVPIKSPKISLDHFESGASNFLYFQFRLLMDMSLLMHQDQIIRPIRMTPALREEQENDFRNTRLTVSLLLTLSRSIYYLDSLQDFNLGPSVSHTVELAVKLMQLTRVFLSSSQSISQSVEVQSISQSVEARSVEVSHINYVSQCCVRLYSTLLRLCEVHGLNEGRLMQILSSQCLQIFSSLSQRNQDDISFPRSVIFTALSVLPTLCLQLGHKVASDMHRLIALTIPNPNQDPSMWMFYLQQTRRLCLEVTSALPTPGHSRIEVRNHSLTPVLVPAALNESYDRLEERLKWTEGPLIQIPLVIATMKTIREIVEEIIDDRLFSKDGDDIIIARFPIGTPAYLINSFNEMICEYLHLLKAIGTETKISNKLPILTTGYLITKVIMKS